ncbi:helix-turn-helix domain-containing protein [Streptomyces sp. NPDC127098]|uniref:helix-turn-helix domain-containing protein n=1 Tax=Streptomyces sp. NPDC127098 TaxID=3347137 RepID=UPI00365F6CFF
MSAFIGDRLRDTRKRRGLSQRDLAKRSGVSYSLVRKLEQGDRQSTTMETVRKLADALNVPTSSLVTATSETGADAATVDRWAAVRQALAGTYPGGDAAEEPTVAGVMASLDSAMPLFSSDSFAQLGALLPALIRDADILAGLDERGRQVQARLLQLTGWLMVQTRQFDIADDVLARALATAGDRLEAAAVVNSQCWLLLRRGQLAESRQLATRWADDIEPRRPSRATLDELSAWGSMLLRVSGAAVRDNRKEEAKDALRWAAAAAVGMGREHQPQADIMRTFGPVTVALKRAENAMVIDKPDHVLRLAGQVPKGGLRPTSNNRNRHLLDVADAHARMRQYSEAVEKLQQIMDKSPQWLPNQRYAQDIMGRVIARRRTLTPEMRQLADAIRVPM